MRDFTVSAAPPPGWDRACDAASALLSASSWLRVLEAGFGASTIYLWNGSAGAAVTVFRAGPFRVGYLGFPAGATIGAGRDVRDWLIASRGRALPSPLACLRIPCSGFDAPPDDDLPWTGTPETAIADLQSWQPADVSRNLRRDLRRAEQTGLGIRAATGAAAGDALYRIYKETIRRHRGSLRYTHAYFRALASLAGDDPRLRVLVAGHGEQVAGFLVTARHGATTYYLHGGADPGFRQASPSDLLLARAISDARADGSLCFNLMSSPPDQPGLVRYKEKWGGTTREHRTSTLSLGWTYPLFRLAELGYRLLRPAPRFLSTTMKPGNRNGTSR